MPPLSEFVQEDYPRISTELRGEEAAEIMIANHITEIPVVDNTEKYVGFLSLYTVLDNPQVQVKAMIDEKAKPIKENMEIDLVLSELDESKSPSLPVVSQEGHLVGVVNRQTLFQALHQFYLSKRGGQ